jgi:lipopolysaccharide/colanic/teichoic acid biosynthesis glycosyltransferase
MGQNIHEEASRSMSSESVEQASIPSNSLPLGLRKAFAAVALCAAGIPLLGAALVTWVSLGRPLFFFQERVGLNGVPFRIIKFRTMSNTTDASGTPLSDEQRTPTASRFLRRMRLDELPQLLSILRGDMAFVGPRPLLPETIREMGMWGVQRCKVRPGLTGWSQVSGGPLLTNDQKLALDLWYVEKRSVWLDLAIVLKTLLVVFRGDRINLRNVAEAEHLMRLANIRRGGR